MNRFQDIFIKRELMATLAVVSTVGLVLVSGRFASDELITHPHSLKS